MIGQVRLPVPVSTPSLADVIDTVSEQNKCSKLLDLRAIFYRYAPVFHAVLKSASEFRAVSVFENGKKNLL